MIAILNFFIWALALIITITWSAGSFLKSEKMGGKASWGTTNYKMAIMFIISVLLVFFLKLPPLNLIFLFIASMLISGSVSTSELVNYAKKNNIAPEQVEMIDLPDTSGLIKSLVYFFAIFVMIYYLNFYGF